MNSEKQSLGNVELFKEHICGSKDGRNYEFDAYTIKVKGVDIGIAIRKEDKKVFELAMDGKIK